MRGPHEISSHKIAKNLKDKTEEMFFHNMEEDMSINGKLCKKVFIGRGYSTRAYLQVHNQQTEAVWHNGNGGLHA